jgi:HSP20 family protein
MSRTGTSLARVPAFGSVFTGSPFEDLFSIQRGMNRLMTDSFGTRERNEAALAAWSPVVDVYEDENSYLIKAELPGVARDDVKVGLDRNLLTISGERRLEQEEKRENYHRIERSYGQFFRSFSLPPNVNTEAIAAEFKDGVLKLSLPKKEESKPKQIQVAVK